jgi:putative phosphoribosyl transferase
MKPAHEREILPRPLELVPARATFRDRAAAGRALARSLGAYRGQPGVVVLGLARGGVPVARQVADALRAPIGVVVARKVGVPGIEEVALGAVAEGNHRVIADTVAWYLGVPSRIVDRLAARERAELERSVATYRLALPSFALRGRTVIVVDDGLATGATMRAAIRSVRDRGPARVIAAVPVASRPAAEDVHRDVDELVVIVMPPRFHTVSASYENYSPVSDDDVLSLIGQPTRRVSSEVVGVGHGLGAALPRTDKAARETERTIGIPAFDATVVGELGVPRVVRTLRRWERPEGVRGLVILSSAGGGSRNSYIERYLGGRLRLSGYATLRVDLLTREEQFADAAGGSLRLDVQRTAARLAGVCEWAEREGVAGAHRTILAAAGAGAAAAFATAGRRRGRIFAVVARGGRVDLAAADLRSVLAPVLLIAGADDPDALRRNSDAVGRLPHAALIRIARAGPTFEEPGALGAVAEHAVAWLDGLDARYRSGDSSNA